MTIWILALVLMGSAAAAGYRQGVIRVAFSLFGIPIAALMTLPLARFAKPAFKVFGVGSPVLLSILGSLLVFIVILTIFKVSGFAVHKKVDVFYRYKTSDLRFALWERLNARLGMCLGLVNGLLYLVLISLAIYLGSYWTVQVSTPDTQMKSARLLNRLGEDLESSGMINAATAIQHMPKDYYEAADIVGLLYQNPALEARLSRYPGFLSLGEQPDIQSLAHDSAYTEMLMRRAPIGELLKSSRTQAILKNTNLLHTIWSTVEPNLDDLTNFLYTAQSPKYDSEPLLGRWFFDPRSSMLAYRREKPTLPATEVQKVRQWMTARYGRVALVAAPDHLAVLKNFPKQDPTSMETETLRGHWSKSGGDYTITLDSSGEQIPMHFEGSRLAMTSQNIQLMFEKEE